MTPHPRAEALLRDLSRAFGLESLAFDADGLVTLRHGDVDLALVYNEQRESFFLMAPCGEAGREEQSPLLTEIPLGPPHAQRLWARVAKAGPCLLVEERPADTLDYVELLNAIEGLSSSVRADESNCSKDLSSELPAEAFSIIAP